MTWEKGRLRDELSSFGYRPSQELRSVVLVGGKGTRLSPQRKLLHQKDYPELDQEHWGSEGPKGLAMVNMRTEREVVAKPMTDWHLDVHVSCEEVRHITLSFGVSSEVMIQYYRRRHRSRYRGVPLDFIVERRPAGTLAPIIKLHQQGRLPEGPMVYANGDNLMDIDLYLCYLCGCLLACRLGGDPQEVVIDVVSLVPWQESHSYGTVDLDFDSGRVRGFHEKAPVEENVHVSLDGQELTPINSGFSIIVNPRAIFSEYLTDEVIETSCELEKGSLDYRQHESLVKYEKLYETIARSGRMIAVHLPTYWTDLGTEEKISAAEQVFSTTRVAQRAAGESI